MNTFVDLVFIFIFVFVLITLLIDIRQGLVVNKLLVFLGVTIFTSILSVMKSIRRRCPVDTWRSINAGVLTGIFAFVGYTLLWDLNCFEGPSRDFVESTSNSIPGGIETVLALTIVLAIAFGRSARYIFTADDCNM